MNVMLFSRIIARSGVGNHIKQLAEEMIRQGHKVVVVSSTDDLHLEMIVGGGDFQFVTIPSITLDPLDILKGVRLIRRIIEEHRIEIVHCHHRMVALYMKFYRMIFRIPMVYTLHLSDIPADFAHKLMTYTGDRAIGVSSEVCRFLIRKLEIPAHKVCLIFNGVDPCSLHPLTEQERQTFCLKWGISPADKTIFVLHSRISEVKNHLLIVEAVKRMPEEIRSRIAVVCSGQKTGPYYERLCEKIQAYHLDSLFVFTDWAETREILGIADALLLPSTKEGFPLSVVEAFLMQVPVFRTRVEGFEDQRYCHEIPVDDAEKVAQILGDFIQNRRKYTEISETAYKYARENLTISQMTKNVLQVYSQVINT